MRDFPGSSRLLGSARIALVVACGLVGALSCANSSHPISKIDGAAGNGAAGSGATGGTSGGTDASGDVPVTPTPDSGSPSDAPGGTLTTGKPCTADNQCGSGFCTDGVCCQTACHETCWTCSAGNSVGTCVPADVGTDPRNDCADEGLASCGNDGTCDGSGACRHYPTGTICRQPTCSGSTLTLASRCQAGVCQPTSGLPCDPYVCDSKAGNACLRTCASNADCGGGNVCDDKGSCGKRPVGVSCTTNDDCNSNICQQGFCCQTACAGTCMSCGVPGSAGVCTAVPAGTDPLDQCADSGRTTCGADGLCDGKGGCETYSKATVCQDPTCAVGGSVGTAPAHCDGLGTCTAASSVSCNEYMCGTTGTCLVNCKTNADCSPGNVCNGGICGKKVLGAMCTLNNECATGSCQQGVCCDKVCTGTCMACNQASSPGRCLPLPSGTSAPAGQCATAAASPCGNDGKCDGAGHCRLQMKGTICKDQTCSMAVETLAGNCDGMGSCGNGTALPCDPFQCGTNATCLGTCNPANANADCTTGNVCTPSASMPTTGSCGKKPLGTPCTLGSECGSNVCDSVAGVCCDMACSGTCKSCALTGSIGKCSNVPDGQDPLGQCAADPVSTCKQDGFCDGNGACRNYAAATICVAGVCSGATFTTARTCDGAGTCQPSTTSTCPGSFACDTTNPNNQICKTTCAQATSSADCIAPATCSGTACVLKGNGVACGANNECATGFCQQGVCCASACDVTCKACNLPGATTLGVCSNVPPTTVDGRCTVTAASTCGTDGTCDGSGNCHLYSTATQCAPGVCPTGTANLTPPRNCDGVGHCSAPTARACDPFLCDGSACKTSCTVATTTADCSPPNSCQSTMTCGKKPTGVTCTMGTECNSNNCSQGFCCDKDCSGTCQSCALAGKVGTCSLVPAGALPVPGQCPPAPQSGCGFDGTCDGSGSCKDWASGTICVNPICTTGNTLVQPRVCNGTGTCQTSTSGACPGNFNCNGTNACRVSCTIPTQTTDCTSPAVCTGNICGTVRVQYMCADTNAKSQSPHPQFKVLNLSTTAINLSTLTIRYWFTGDGAVTFGGAIDFATNSAGQQIQSQLSLTFVTVSRTGADHYMQVNFGAGAGTLTSASPIFVQSRFNSSNPDFGVTFTQTGDYSFDPTKTTLTDWTQVTMYQNGVLIWGIEPP